MEAVDGKAPAELRGSIGLLFLVPWFMLAFLVFAYLVVPLAFSPGQPVTPAPKQGAADRAGPWFALAIFAGGLLAFGLCCARTIRIAPDGIQIGTMWFGSKRLDWSEVTALRAWRYTHGFWKYEGLSLKIVRKRGHCWVIAPLPFGGQELARFMASIGRSDVLQLREM